MIDLDIDAGAATISKLLTGFQLGQIRREETIAQVLGFLSEATQGIDLTAEDHKQVEVYAMTLLQNIETHVLDPDTAAMDLCALRRAAEANDPSFLDLIEVPQE